MILNHSRLILPKLPTVNLAGAGLGIGQRSSDNFIFSNDACATRYNLCCLRKHVQFFFNQFIQKNSIYLKENRLTADYRHSLFIQEIHYSFIEFSKFLKYLDSRISSLNSGMHPWSSFYSTRIYADCAEKLRLLGLPIEIPISASAYTPGWTEIISKYMAFVYIGIDFKIDAEMTQFHLKFPKLRAEFGGLFSIDTGFNKVHLLLIGSEKYITIKNIQLMQDIIIPSKPKKSKQEPKKQDVECFFLPNNSSVALKDFWLVNILNAEETIFCNFDINKLRETNQLVLKAN